MFLDEASKSKENRMAEQRETQPRHDVVGWLEVKQ